MAGGNDPNDPNYGSTPHPWDYDPFDQRNWRDGTPSGLDLRNRGKGGPDPTYEAVPRDLNAAGKWIGDAWNNINGARTPDPVGFNQGMGQAGPTQNAGLAPGVVGYGADQNAQGRGMQMALIQQLQDQAAGKGPSLAQMQLQKATDQNMSQAMALGASQRGAGAAGMNKGIAGQQAQIGQGMANDSAMLRLQEQMAAQGALGTQIGNMRGQDQGFAGQQNQNNQFNAGQQNQSNQFNAGQYNQYQDSNAARAQQAAIEQAKLDMERQKLLADSASKSSPIGAVGGFMSAMSDERLKEDIAPGEAKLYAFLDKLGSHDYKYKDAKHGDGRRISPMAQELEQSDLGKAFVFEAKDGKAVDYGKGFGTMLAAQAALHKRLKALEG